jgi:hypothetical protein
MTFLADMTLIKVRGRNEPGARGTLRQKTSEQNVKYELRKKESQKRYQC